MASLFSDGAITRQLLKFQSCEFDVESIHTLSLKNQSISDLGCISECINLENLDLSNNKLTKLHKLAGLKSLRKLNLSANIITSLDGLQSLENLESLNISGNLLGSTDSLRSICSLQNLKNLKLNDKAFGLSNPMCNTKYVDEVLLLLPTLTQLDDQRVRGQGQELFSLSNEIEKSLLGLHPSKSTTIRNNDFDINSEELDFPSISTKSQRVSTAEQELIDLLQDCAALNKQAVQILTKTKATQNLSLET
ncbi:leucine-rich repeat-containing protein 61 [Biomphalaria glabrata]|nr:leucine-rich repeat-containing protein 61 [Biomphalaria glabrata]